MPPIDHDMLNFREHAISLLVPTSTLCCLGSGTLPQNVTGECQYGSHGVAVLPSPMDLVVGNGSCHYLASNIPLTLSCTDIHSVIANMVLSLRYTTNSCQFVFMSHQ